MTQFIAKEIQIIEKDLNWGQKFALERNALEITLGGTTWINVPEFILNVFEKTPYFGLSQLGDLYEQGTYQPPEFQLFKDGEREKEYIQRKLENLTNFLREKEYKFDKTNNQYKMHVD